MKFNETISLVFAAELQPSATASLIHFIRPIPSKDKMLFATERISPYNQDSRARID
jgi:hypothetical protein